MVGPWQVPVADCAVTLRDFIGTAEQTMAMGERAACCAQRAGIGAYGCRRGNHQYRCCTVTAISDIKLSANWMAAVDVAGEDAALFDAVHAVGMGYCPALGIGIPVGKGFDEHAHRAWTEGSTKKSVHARCR